jgi:hypothetical protein
VYILPSFLPSFAIDAERQIGLPAINGYSDTRTFVTENFPTFNSHVDRIIEYINHVTMRLLLYQLATRPIELFGISYPLRTCLTETSRGVVLRHERDNARRCGRMWMVNLHPV